MAPNHHPLTMQVWPLLGFLIGQIANRTFRFCEDHDYVGSASSIVFYLLLAILSIGIGSTLGSDDLLVALGAGLGSANDGWFAAKTKTARFPVIIDLLLNSIMFVYFGADPVGPLHPARYHSPTRGMATHPLPSACIGLPPDPNHASCQAYCP